MLLGLLSAAIDGSCNAEDALEQSVKQGTRQYVLLGAGFDTFAFRRPEWAGNLRVFELDEPAMSLFHSIALGGRKKHPAAP